MDYTTGILLAHQRMRELGRTPEQYHFEVVLIVGTGLERLNKVIYLSAYNQIYFLLNDASCKNLYIIGDSGYFNTADFLNGRSLEFTGKIEIGQTVSPWSIEPVAGTIVPLEFLKVTLF